LLLPIITVDVIGAALHHGDVIISVSSRTVNAFAIPAAESHQLSGYF